MISLYDATARRFATTVEALEGVLAKGLAHCESTGEDPQSLVTAQLAPDMLPLWFQIASVRHHSLAALEGARSGLFGPPPRDADKTYAQLRADLAETRAGLQAFTPAVVEALQEGDVVFRLRDGMEMAFTALDFLLGFSVPNFYFHAATAYDLLRLRGVPLGKRDFIGALPTKG